MKRILFFIVFMVLCMTSYAQNGGILTPIYNLLWDDETAPGITIVKDVTNDSGGNSGAGDFILHLSGTGVDGGVDRTSGDTIAVNANTPYTLSEDALAGYTQTGIVCRDDGTDADIGHPATLDPEQSATCTISNDDAACSDTGDSDGDRLLNCYETNTGVFISATNTGTNPNLSDTDNDGISDGDEVLGTTTGLNLPAMGLNPLRVNILLEYDWFDDGLDCGSHTHRPTVAQINMFASSFANSPNINPDGSSGITVINDYGQGGAFTGGNQVIDANGVLVGGVSNSEFLNYKASNFNTNRNGYFHYVILPHRYNTSSGSSGQAEILGDDLIVSLQCYLSTPNVANTIMHELGHNLNLRHGGNTNCNYKPNYNSVMNYRYQFPGVDNDCNVSGNGVLNYSPGTNITLVESNLNENNGVCGPSTVSVDWNLNTVIESAVSFDINSDDAFQASNCGGILTTLSDFDDWSNITLTGLSDADGLHAGPVEIVSCINAPSH